MGIGDTLPSGGYHPKKPLTKAQIQKMAEAYKNADQITAEVRAKELEEQKKSNNETEDLLKLV